MGDPSNPSPHQQAADLDLLSSSQTAQAPQLPQTSQTIAPELISPAVPKDPASRGRSAPRSKKGCWTCRERKVKCDEARPECARCVQAHRECTYVIPTGRRKRVYVAQQLQELQDQQQRQEQETQDIKDPTTPATASPASRDSPSHALPLRTRSSTPRDHNVKHAGPSAGSSPSSGPPPHDENDIINFYKEQYLMNLSTKRPQWSFFAGVINLGQADSALMHILMANGRLDYRGEGDELEGLKHYTSGLRDLAEAFTAGRFDPLTLLMTMFMLVQFELRHAERAEHIRSHLKGLTALLIAHGSRIVPALARFDGGQTQMSPYGYQQPSPQQPSPYQQPSPQQPGPQPYIKAEETSPPSVLGSRDYSEDALIRYRGVLNKIALYVNYFDSAASSWDLDGGVMDFFTVRWPGALELLVTESKTALTELWGDEYPQSEATDDLVNEPVWDLFHHANALRYRVSLFRRALANDPETATALHAEIAYKFDTLNKQHADFIRSAPLWPQTDDPPPRMVTNLRIVVPYHHAVQLDFYRAAGNVAAAQRHALAIIQISVLVHEMEPLASLSRLAWPMFLAGTESMDAAHQGWLLERMKELAVMGISFKRGYVLLRGFVKRRRRTGEWYDYRRWLVEGKEYERFIL